MTRAGGGRGLEAKLAALAAIARAPIDDAARAAVRDALRAKTGLLVAAAARLVADHGLEPLVAELAPAFARLLDRPIERDPGCRGKIAVARALHALDAWDDAVFVPGARWVQLEPVWGGREDTAAELRGVCGLAFAHAGRADALDVLATLLADPQRIARAAAAQALGDTGRPDAAALLRFKALIGDDEPEVIAACLGSMLALAPAASVPFVAGLLGDAARGDAAALALGESRRAEAVAPLVAWCEGAPAAARARVGYLALALTRAEEATAWLLGVVRSGARADAVAAATALATFRHDPALAARALAAGDAHSDRAVRAAVREAFAGA